MAVVSFGRRHVSFEATAKRPTNVLLRQERKYGALFGRTRENKNPLFRWEL